MRLTIIAEASDLLQRLGFELSQRGLQCSLISPEAAEGLNSTDPEILLLVLNGSTAELTQRLKRRITLPLLALVSREMLSGLEILQNFDDFVLEPWEADEVILRAKRILGRLREGTGGQVIKRGELLIDLARCEVSLGGKSVPLTFKEYELLKFLARHPGRVFPRETLLDEVWGPDYYGGDRTVDVHIRRLRSKLGDSAHSLIETVRNIGYRFRSQT